MAEFLPNPGVQANPENAENGSIIITKWNADVDASHFSMRGRHVAGSPHNRPISVSAGGKLPATRPLGLSVPCVLPEVDIVSGGNFTGKIQLGIRKYRGSDGQASDICPMWPPQDQNITEYTSTGDSGFQINDDTLVTGYVAVEGEAGTNQKVAVIFQVPSNKSSAQSPFDGVKAALFREGNPTGKLRMKLYDVANNTSSTLTHTPTTAITNTDMLVDLTSCPPAGDGANVAMAKEALLNKATFYSVVTDQIPYGQDTAPTTNYVKWAYIDFQWTRIALDFFATTASTERFDAVVASSTTTQSVAFQIKKTTNPSSGARPIRTLYALKSNDQKVLLCGPANGYKLEANVPKRDGISLADIVDATGISLPSWQDKGTYYQLNKVFYTDISLMETTDGGSSWTKIATMENVPNEAETLNSVCVEVAYAEASITRRYAIVWDGDGSVSIRRFDGSTLDDRIEIVTGVPTAASVVKFSISDASASIMYLAIKDDGANSGVYVSLDAGATWALENGSGSDEIDFPAEMTHVEADPGDALYAYCTILDEGPAGTKGRAYFTNDQGASWFQYTGLAATLIVTEQVMCCALGDSNDMYLGTSQGRILKTTDRKNAAATWSVVTTIAVAEAFGITSTINKVDAIYVSPFSDAYLYAVVNTDFGHMLHYKDYGASTWSRVNRAIQNGVRQYVYVPSRLAFAPSNVAPSRFYVGDSYSANELYVTDDTAPVYNAYAMQAGSWVWLGPYRKLFCMVKAAPTLKRYGQVALEQRFSTKFADLSSQKLIISNLQEYVGDAQHEDYDKLQVCVGSDVFGGEFVIAAELDLDQDSFTINEATFLTSLINKPTIQPFTNWPFAGHKDMKALRIGQNQSMVALGLSPWDNYIDADIEIATGVKYLRKVNQPDGGSSWTFGERPRGALTWTQGLDGISDPADYDGDGSSLDKMLCTIYRDDPGNYATIDGKNMVVAGERIASGQISIQNGVAYLTNVTGSVYSVTSGIAVGEGGSGLRAEFRRQVLARVERDSDEVSLFYGDDDTEALICEEWMVWNNVQIDGVRGLGTVVRVDPNMTDDATTLYPCMAYYPTNKLRLLSLWKGDTGTGQFSLTGDTNSIWFGQDRADNWEGTGPKLRYICNNTIPLVAIGFCQGRMVAIAEHSEIVEFDFPNGGVFLPTTITGIVGYDISLDVKASDPKRHQFTCFGPRGVWNDDMGNLYWAGTNGIYQYNGNTVTLISTKKVEEYLKNSTKDSLTDLCIAGDVNFPYGPACRIGGLTEKYGITRDRLKTNKSTGTAVDVVRDYETSTNTEVTWHQVRERRNRQLVFLLNEQQFIELKDFGEIHSMSTVLCNDGSSRVMVGANGMLWLYALPYSRGSTTVTENAFTIGRVNQTSLYLTNFPGSQFVNGAATTSVTFRMTLGVSQDFAQVDFWKFLQQAGHLLTIIDPNTGTWKTAEILFPTAIPDALLVGSSFTVLLQPIPADAAFADADVDYLLIIGPRFSDMTFPSVTPPTGYRNTRIEKVQAEIEDNGASDTFNWPLNFQVHMSKGEAQIDNSYTITRDYRTGRSNLYFEELVMHQISHEAYVSFSFVNPPNDSLVWQGFQMWARDER